MSDMIEMRKVSPAYEKLDLHHVHRAIGTVRCGLAKKGPDRRSPFTPRCLKGMTCLRGRSRVHEERGRNSAALAANESAQAGDAFQLEV
jgi:hypothetical protein